MAQVVNKADDTLETVVNANADSLQDENKPDGEDAPPMPKEEQDEDESLTAADILKVETKVVKKQGNDSQLKPEEETKPKDYYRSQEEVNKAFKLRIGKEVEPLKAEIERLKNELKSRDDGAKVSELAAQIAKEKNLDPDIAELIAERQLAKTPPKEPDKPAPKTIDPNEELEREYSEAYEEYADEYTEEEFEEAVNEALKDEKFVKAFRGGTLKAAFRPIYKAHIKGESATNNDEEIAQRNAKIPSVNKPASAPPVIDVTKMSDADFKKLDSELQRGNKIRI